ncbi:MAG: hypothetical protein ACE5FE_08370 [Acidiferrobacterales bacterium]
MLKVALAFVIPLSLLPGCYVVAYADQEAGNRTYVTASEYGQFYAKSIPHERYGLRGVTKVYQVGDKVDTLIQTYLWYSPRIFLEGFTGTQTVYVVQLGPWHRGHQASREHHAIAFYKNDTLLRKYSTLDIVGSAENVSFSVSHYTVFAKILGFRRPFGNQLVFDVEGHKGRLFSFDTETGALLPKEEGDVKKQLYEARVKIGQIKWRWYEKNKDKMANINEFVITEEILRQFAPTDFPDLPQGYRYLPGAMWKPIRFQGEQS